VIASAAEVEAIRTLGLVVVAVVTAIGGFLANQQRLASKRQEELQQRVHEDNRNDHAQTAAKVDQLLVGQAEIKADLTDVKADVRELKATDRDHEHRIEALEPTPIKSRTTRKKAAS
jgi:uncharacterized protein HemX